MNRTFQERYDAIGQLMERRGGLRAAHRQAEQLVDDFPEVAAGYYLLNLIMCIGNFGGGALHGSPRIIMRAQDHATDFDNVVQGDMLRDRAIGLIRFRGPGYANLAIRAIAHATNLHAGEGNREICLIGIKGRLATAERRYADACELHEQADRSWRALGSRADAGMAYLNLVQWLRAEVGRAGRNSPQARELAERIKNECPPQLRNRSAQAFILRTPLIGGYAYHFVETHRR